MQGVVMTYHMELPVAMESEDVSNRPAYLHAVV